MQVRRLALVKQREAKAAVPKVPSVEVRMAGPSPTRERPASASSAPRLTDHWLTAPPAMLEEVEPYLQFAASNRPMSAQRGAARSNTVAQRPSSAAARSQQLHSGTDAASCARPSSAQPQQPPQHRQPPQQPLQQPQVQQAYGSSLRRPGSAQPLRRPTSANLGSRSASPAVTAATAPSRRPRPASASAAGGLARSHTTVALLQRPLSASRVSATEGTRTMAAAASAAAAGTRATAAAAVAAANAAAANAPHHAAYRPTRVASAVPDELRVTTWLPIYTGHDLPAADRDSGFAWRHGGVEQPAELEFLPHTAEVFITAEGAEEGEDDAAQQETGAAGGRGDEHDDGGSAPASAPASTAPPPPTQQPPPPTAVTTKKGPPPAAMLPSEGWGRQEFPSHSGKPSRNHAELLLAMLKAVEEQEVAQQQKERGGGGAGAGAAAGGAGGGGGSMAAEAAELEAAAARLEKGRKLYGGVAAELCRQLRSESKQRAQVYEACLARAWRLSDAVLPQLRKATAAATSLAAEGDSLKEELRRCEKQTAAAEAETTQANLRLSKFRRERAQSEVALLAAQAKVQHLEEALTETREDNARLVKAAEAAGIELQEAEWAQERQQNTIAATQHEAEEAAKALERLQRRWANDCAMLEKVDDELAKANESIEKLEQERWLQTQKEKRLEAEIGELRVSLRRAVEDATASIKQARAEGEAERNSLKHELAKARATMARERADAATALQSCTEQRDALQADNDSLTAKLSVAEDRARIVEEKMNAMRDHNEKDYAKLRQLQTAKEVEHIKLEQARRYARRYARPAAPLPHPQPACLLGPGPACRRARPLPIHFSLLLILQARKEVEEAKAAQIELEQRAASQAAQLEAVSNELGNTKPLVDKLKAELADAHRALADTRAKAAGLEARARPRS